MKIIPIVRLSLGHERSLGFIAWSLLVSVLMALQYLVIPFIKLAFHLPRLE